MIVYKFRNLEDLKLAIKDARAVGDLCEYSERDLWIGLWNNAKQDLVYEFENVYMVNIV